MSSRKTIQVVDMFCGAGGESTGIRKAAERLDLNIRLTAINHWERAIETHAANHPDAEHLCQSIQYLDPVKVVPEQKVDLLWASPECTHHSLARGGRPRSDQSRASAWLVLKWLSELYVERVIIENVPEFLSWGPLDDQGRPIKSEKGKTFRAFILSLRSLGYTVDWRILTAADYGDPTIRRRLFVQAVKGRKKICWPEVTYVEDNGTDGDNLFGYSKWKSARDIIDWSIPGTSIFDRKKPLAKATLRRIERGIEKYWGQYAAPFIAVLRGTSTVRSLDVPLPTVTCSGAHYALIQPFLINTGQTSVKDRSKCEAAWLTSQPLPTVAAAGAISLITPFITEYYGTGENVSSLCDPLRTITTKDRFALVNPQILSGGNKPGSVKLDIRFRMLKAHELAKAHSFPDSYRFCGNTTEQVKQIGNSVPVETAAALAETIFQEE
jgi:DNA (cytosine-5)-methyltransferase 1